jgi:hypothetical protein
MKGTKHMKRTFALIPAALVAAALVGGLVHAVLVVTNLSEPAATTVYGPTPQRLWVAAIAVLALGGVGIGGLALARPASRFDTASGRLGAIVTLVAGLIAVVNGGLLLAIADGGPGTGNGVVGGAGALVLGLIAMALGGLALARSRRTAVVSASHQVSNGAGGNAAATPRSCRMVASSTRLPIRLEPTSSRPSHSSSLLSGRPSHTGSAVACAARSVWSLSGIVIA